jgi:hypothetical protein
MANLRQVLKTDFNIDRARLSPRLRACLERLNKLEEDADAFARYMSLPADKQRKAWRVIAADEDAGNE